MIPPPPALPTRQLAASLCWRHRLCEERYQASQRDVVAGAGSFPTVPKRHMQQLSSRLTATPPILAQAGSILERYEVLFCDVWGVVHDGVSAYPRACEALIRFRRAGGTVVLVSNAPVPNAQVARMLESRRVPRDAWDAIVSSGDIALAHVAEQGYRSLHFIGPADRDSALFSAVAEKRAAFEVADAILCSGLEDDVNETALDYRPLLERAFDRGLPFVCANPDFVVDVGGRLYPCAGAIAELYAHMGGPVFWAGKPHPSAYGTALEVAERLRGRPMDRSKILGIGDAVRTDLKSAEGIGIDAIFIAAGIHRHETMVGDEIELERLTELFTANPVPALAAMPILAW